MKGDTQVGTHLGVDLLGDLQDLQEAAEILTTVTATTRADPGETQGVNQNLNVNSVGVKIISQEIRIVLRLKNIVICATRWPITSTIVIFDEMHPPVLTVEGTLITTHLNALRNNRMRCASKRKSSNNQTWTGRCSTPTGKRKCN